MTARLAIALSLILAGCGYAEVDYLTDEAAAACAFSVDCYPGLYESADDCVAQRGASVSTGACAFDPVAAKDCVDGLEAMDCPEDGAFPTFPTACDAVYSACEQGA